MLMRLMLLIISIMKCPFHWASHKFDKKCEVCVLVTFYKQGHFVIPIKKSTHLLSVQVWTYLICKFSLSQTKSGNLWWKDRLLQSLMVIKVSIPCLCLQCMIVSNKCHLQCKETKLEPPWKLFNIFCQIFNAALGLNTYLTALCPVKSKKQPASSKIAAYLPRGKKNSNSTSSDSKFLL